MSVFGSLLPFVGRVITPCDADGIPAFSPEEERAAHFETPAVCVAWFGFAGLFPFGEVTSRAIDPINPRQYAKGTL